MTDASGSAVGHAVLDRVLVALRRWAAALHERLLSPFDAVGRTALRLARAAGPGAVVVRSSRPPGYGAAVGVALLVVGVVQQATAFVGSAVTDGDVELLAGRGALVLAALALGVDLVLRLAGPALVAVGPAGVALAFPPRSRPAGETQIRLGGTDAMTPVDLVPWSDVAAVVHVRDAGRPGTHPVAQLGVRTRRALTSPWPRDADPATLPPDPASAGFGTRLLTRPVAVLDEVRVRRLRRSCERFAPDTPFLDTDLAGVVR
ncbi:hypothetical protein [Phycicoccus flavus]|uniref:hypothetical protein n=1 Tax=Phycicoccus flavus TaxID=2502783 RepID=UPI000FEBC001|nr:hypothetical protein [Phycicoccus flavus]NHA70119.1 hypothetical protein [Phycicoccus flavus]